MDLTAPPLFPLAVLAMASSGSLGTPAPMALEPALRAGTHRGATAQERPVVLRVREGGRRAGWQIGYVARCGDGSTVRGRYFSGVGTPEVEIGPEGRFRLTGTDPAQFKPEGTGTARFALRGRIGPRGGSGSFRVKLVTPPVEGRRVACTAGPVSWRVGRD